VLVEEKSLKNGQRGKEKRVIEEVGSPSQNPSRNSLRDSPCQEHTLHLKSPPKDTP